MFVCMTTPPNHLIICAWYFWIESLEQNYRFRKWTDMRHTCYELQILGSSPPSESSSCFSDCQRVAPPKNLRKRVVDFRHRRDFQLDDKALRKAEAGTLQQKRVRQWFLTVVASLTGWPKTKRWRHKTWWPWCQTYPHTWHLKEKGIDDFYAKLWLPSCSWLIRSVEAGMSIRTLTRWNQGIWWDHSNPFQVSSKIFVCTSAFP